MQAGITNLPERILLPLAGLTLGLVSGFAPADAVAASFYDYAQVIDAQPLVEQERVAVHRADCKARQATAGPIEEPGWLGERQPGPGLAEWIRRDALLRDPGGARCTDAVAYEVRERVVGYEVRYRYAGQEYRRRMDHHPGRRLRVRVDMEPGH